jgi:DNA-binding MarR family transcriptional regulator
VVTRAGVAESAFYDIFATAEHCYHAAFDEGLARLARAVGQSAARGRSWSERVRAGVVGLLGFFDDEPEWGRLLMLEAPIASTPAGMASTPAPTASMPALTARQRLLGVLTLLLDEAPTETQASPVSGLAAQAQASPVSGLTAELIAGGVMSVIRARMDEPDGEPFVELGPSLISFIAVQYGGAAAAGPLPRPREHAPAWEISSAAQLPIRATHRTTQVLRAIGHAPYANNREVAEAAGIADEGQASKLLARLERRGVIENVGVGATRGEPNAWLLTESGRRALEVLAKSFRDSAPVSRAGRFA